MEGAENTMHLKYKIVLPKSIQNVVFSIFAGAT